MENASRPFLVTGNPAMLENDCACTDTNYVLYVNQGIEQLNDDCACADTQIARGEQTRPFPQYPYIKTADSHTASLPKSYHLAFSPYALGGPSILNHAAWERWHQFAQPQPVAKPFDKQLAAQGLIHPNLTPPTIQAGQPQILTAWLHITNACNLDCPYCYVRKSSARMSLETGRQAVAAIFDTAKKNGFSQVKLKYAGGEATLHFKRIRQLHEYAQALSQMVGIGLKAVVLTNGVMLCKEDAHWLYKNHVKVAVSLDGVGAMHNQLRPLPTGAPFDTFSRVAHTIDDVLLPLGIRPDITMTVTAVNARGTADLAKWALIDRNLPTSFNFYRQNTQSSSHTELALEEEAIIQGMLAAYKVIEQHLPERPFLDGLLDRVQTQAHTHTCGVGQSYIVISHTGQISQCQMHVNTPMTTTFNEDLLLTVQQGPLKNLSVHEKDACSTCQFRYRCSGGCPLEAYRQTGQWHARNPNCHIYKTLYPEALRLEGLRLMKINGLLT
ncbi:MAG: hypothetical protein Kow0080_24220 [Candidatus Promineifilaceae bacterium]